MYYQVSIVWLSNLMVTFDNDKIEMKRLIKTHEIIVFSKGAHFLRKYFSIGKALYEINK